MCFSTEASFGAGAILTVVGIATLRKTKSRSQLAFAAIPLIFGIQQFIEGFVWLSLSNADYAYLKQTPAYLFLIIAQVVWPIWIPLSMFLMEKEEKLKKFLAGLLAIGIILSLCVIYNLTTYTILPEIMEHHIHYTLNIPSWMIPIGGFLYFLPTVISPFVSSVKRTNFLGMTILTSYLVSKLFFEQNVISVWCFFAALMSVIVYVVIKDVPEHKPTKKSRSFRK